jgi:hypothetical protein
MRETLGNPVNPGEGNDPNEIVAVNLVVQDCPAGVMQR